MDLFQVGKRHKKRMTFRLLLFECLQKVVKVLLWTFLLVQRR